MYPKQLYSAACNSSIMHIYGNKILTVNCLFQTNNASG